MKLNWTVTDAFMHVTTLMSFHYISSFFVHLINAHRYFIKFHILLCLFFQENSRVGPWESKIMFSQSITMWNHSLSVIDTVDKSVSTQCHQTVDKSVSTQCHQTVDKSVSTQCHQTVDKSVSTQCHQTGQVRLNSVSSNSGQVRLNSVSSNSGQSVSTQCIKQWTSPSQLSVIKQWTSPSQLSVIKQWTSPSQLSVIKQWTSLNSVSTKPEPGLESLHAGRQQHSVPSHSEITCSNLKPWATTYLLDVSS